MDMLFAMRALCFTIFITRFCLTNCGENAERRFDEFHRAYERESLRYGRDLRRDSPSPNTSTLTTRYVTYADGNQTLVGYVAYKESPSPRPVVLIVHDWNGRDKFENDKAEALAHLGYVGFALDLYGTRGSNPQENQALMKPFREDRQFLLTRLNAALQEAKRIRVVDQNKTGAIGFCFGGMGILDMARAGWDLKGVVSFHGTLTPPPQQQNVPVTAKILVLHGHDDPGIPPSAVQAFEEEMTNRRADWQVTCTATLDTRSLCPLRTVPDHDTCR